MPSRNFATKVWDKFTDEETGEKVLQIGLPGFNKEDIEIGLDGDAIFIRGEIKNEEAKKFYKSSVSYSTIDSNIDPESIKASLDNGILEIRYKTQLGKEPKKIEIQ
jgi:HSP20 family molecular chaperone IbpA